MKNLEDLSCANSLRVGGQSINKAASILIVVQDGLRELLGSGTTPHVSILSLPDVTTHDQISRDFPFCICTLQVIKDWRWERPGNEAR